MKIHIKEPARSFFVGNNDKIKIDDCGSIILEDNEQITFLTDCNKEYDVIKKDWGFYATPSINNRLLRQGFKCALVKNKDGFLYVMLVMENKLKLFERYIANEENHLVMWLDEL